jgi:predicted nucleic acid-binding protein
MTVEKPVFIDTNVLVYASDLDSADKREKAKEIVENVFAGRLVASVSNQVLSEFFYAVTRKTASRIPPLEASEIVQAIVGSPKWMKFNYTAETARKAAFASAKTGSSYWDELIVQTMLENGVATIYTENTKDFEGKGIQLVNPFK